MNWFATPSPSPGPVVPSAFTSDLGIEMFLTLLAVIVFAYAFGLLVLHIIASIRKALRNRKRKRDHYDSTGY